MKDKKVALLIATMGSFLAPFMGSSINIALPSIGKEFAMDAILLGWVAMSYLLSAAVFLVPLGKVADIYGRKKIFLYGVSVFTVSAVLCAVSTSAGMLILFRFIQGIGAAMIFGTGIAILMSVFPQSERGKVLGINVASVYIGLSLGPFLGGFLTQHLGWRSVFLINLPLGLIIVLFTLLKLKGEWVQEKKEKLDWTGSIIYGVSLVALIYGFSLLPAAHGIWLIIAGILGISAFIKWESRAQDPVLDMNIFRHNIVFTFSNLSALINYSATSAVGFILSLYLQYVQGISPQKAGLILVSQPVIMAVISPFAGKLSDKIEPRIVASTGMAMSVAGLFLLTFLNGNTPLGFVIIDLLILGIGFGLFSSPNTNAVMSSVDRRFYGVASATLGTMRLIGFMLSMGIVMLIFSVYIGRVQITPEYYPMFLKSAKVLFAIFAALCFGGIFASLARGNVR